MTKLYALDFDRTLGRTVVIAEDFMEYVGSENAVAGGALREKQHQIESTGGSFDMIEALHAQVGEHVLTEYAEGFLRQHRSELYLEDGAKDLIVGIATSAHRLGILTYGGEVWQTIKLKAAGLDSYHRIILSEKGKKGTLIASWYDAECGIYRLPKELGGGTVERVVLVDDKPVEFIGFPETSSARGYLYTGGIKPVAASSLQPVTVNLPSNVGAVRSLRDIVQHESLG